MYILNVIRKELRVFRSKLIKHFIVFIIFPLAMGLMYGVIYNRMMNPSIQLSNIDVIVVNNQISDTSKQILNMLKSNKFINVKEDTDLSALKKSSLGIVIPNESTIQVVNNGEMTLEKKSVISILNNYLNNSSNKLTSNMQAQIKVTEIDIPKKLTSTQIMVTSSFVIFSFLIAVTTATYFLKERESNILKRLGSLNLSKHSIYCGFVLSTFIISFIIVSIYFILTYLIMFKAQISFLKLLIAILLQSLTIAAIYAISIGMFKDNRTYKAVYIPVTVSLMLLGGSFFPVKMFEATYKIAKFTPNYNLQSIFESVLLDKPMTQSLYTIMVLLLISATLILIGNMKFSFREE